MEFITQYGLDFDPMKATVFLAVKPQWRRADFYGDLIDIHPDIAELKDKFETKTQLHAALEIYFKNYYQNNEAELAAAKQKLEAVLRKDSSTITGICESALPDTDWQYKVMTVAVSAVPPHMTLADEPRIDIFAYGNNFGAELLHELMHQRLLGALAATGLSRRLTGGEYSHLFLESVSNQLLEQAGAPLAIEAKGDYEFPGGLEKRLEKIWADPSVTETKLKHSLEAIRGKIRSGG